MGRVLPVRLIVVPLCCASSLDALTLEVTVVHVRARPASHLTEAAPPCVQMISPVLPPTPASLSSVSSLPWSAWVKP